MKNIMTKAQQKPALTPTPIFESGQGRYLRLILPVLLQAMKKGLV